LLLSAGEFLGGAQEVAGAKVTRTKGLTGPVTITLVGRRAGYPERLLRPVTLSSLETRFASLSDAFVILTETVKLMEAFSLTARGANLEIRNPVDLSRFHLHDTPETEFMTDDQAGNWR
jgi:hypothetical protein